MSWLHRFSLRTIIFGSFTVVLLLTMGPTFAFINATIDESLRRSLNTRGSDLAHSLAESESKSFNNPQSGASAIARVAQIAEGEGYVALVRPDLTLIAVTPGADPRELSGALRTFREHGFPQSNDGLELGGGMLLWARAAKDRSIDLIEGSSGGAEQVLGYALVILSDVRVTEVKASVQRAMFMGSIVGLVVFLVLLFLISRVFIMRPLAGMMSVAKRISDCDLTLQPGAQGGDEFGQLGGALHRTAENLRITLAKVKGVSEGIANVIEQISHTGDTVAKGASTAAQSVDETSSSMEQMIASLKGIAENVEVLAQSAEESSSSILEMAATNDEVVENIQTLSASVEETTTAIEQMTFSIKQVARNIEELSATAEETSSSMNEMDISIGQVETNANETARLSEQVSQDADTGAKALQKTLVGIDKIKESSKEAARVIESLGKKIGSIGNILNVIDDVAEQTNLLALNAAIIAAQAGEHGKGFAVVADEIKDLAERTGASTKEISQLIQGVQDESKNAITAMERGVKNVDEGVRLGGEAEGALKKINESSGKATQMVKAIARATVEQARGSKQVTNAITRIAETVMQIAKATAEQAKGSEQMMKSAEKMRSVTKHVERSSQEQSRGSKQITRTIENINEMVAHLNRAQKEQTKGSEQVMKAVESIKGVVDQQNLSMKELERAIDALASQADVLRDEVRRFRV